MAHRPDLGPWASLHTGLCLPGDVLVLATPSLARWVLAEHEARRNLWVHLVSLPGDEREEFAQIVRDLQSTGELLRQHTALLTARIEAPTAADQEASTPAEAADEVDTEREPRVEAIIPRRRIVSSRRRRDGHPENGAPTSAIYGGPIRCYRCGHDFAFGATRCRSCGTNLSRLDQYHTWRRARRWLRRLRRRFRVLLSWL